MPMIRLSRLLLFALVVSACAAPAVAQEQTPTWPREPETPSAPRPAPAAADWLGLIGEYQSAGPAGESVRLYVIERDGQLMAIADRGEPVAIDSTTPRPEFTRDAGGRAIRLTMRGVPYTRLQVGPEGGSGQLRVTPLRPVAEALKDAQAATPPAEGGSFLPADLVELMQLDPTIKLDVRYATTNNFLGSVFYAEARAFLQRPAAEAVVRAHRALAPLGYGLLVHDGYRPWYVTKTFFDTTPPDKKWLVANPAQGSRHNRGAAVDLTLYERATGAPVPMPSGYDEFSARAHPTYPGGTTRQRWHRDLLRATLEAEGFRVYEYEWWHFDFAGWERYPVLNLRFEEIDSR